MTDRSLLRPSPLAPRPSSLFNTLARVDQPVDAAVFFVAQFGFVGVSFAGLVADGSRVVLDDEVVPVDDPDVPVRSDLGHDRAGPFVVAGQQIPRVLRAEARSILANHERGDQVTGGLGDEGGAVPILLRIVAGGVQRVSRRGREATVIVHLTHLVLVERFKLVAVGDPTQHAR